MHHLSKAVSDGNIELDKVTSKIEIIVDTEHSLNSFMGKLRKVCKNALENLKCPNARDKFVQTTIVNTLMEYVPKKAQNLPENPVPASETTVKESGDEKERKTLTLREMLFYMKNPLLKKYGMDSEIFDNTENFGSYFGWYAEEIEAKQCVIPNFFRYNPNNMEHALKFLMGWNALEDGEFKSFSNHAILYLSEALHKDECYGKNPERLITKLNYINRSGIDDYERQMDCESMLNFMDCFFKHYCKQIELYPPKSSNKKGYITKMLLNYLDGEYQARTAHIHADFSNIIESIGISKRKSQNCI